MTEVSPSGIEGHPSFKQPSLLFCLFELFGCFFFYSVLFEVFLQLPAF